MLRHQFYLRALKSTGVIYTLGKFKSKPRQCRNCESTWVGYEEKETDVNIALQIVEDAVDGLADIVYLVSSDSDLAPAVKVLRRRFPKIEFVSIAPPARPHASELLALSTRGKSIKMGVEALKKNRLPESILDSRGEILCPESWKRPY